MKASFFERVGAYFVDFIIITIISSMIGMCLPEKNSEVEKRINEIATATASGEMDIDTYLSEYQGLIYDNQKETILETGISVAITLAYFVIFQYMNKGQTLGKKLLHIKVVDKETKDPISIGRGLLRSLICFGIASSALYMILINILNKSTYMDAYLGIGFVETVFVITTIIMMLYRKDGRGLHDMMAGTMVVKDGESNA